MTDKGWDGWFRLWLRACLDPWWFWMGGEDETGSPMSDRSLN